MATSTISTSEIIAIAAAGVAAVSLLGCCALALGISRLRKTQRVVLGAHDQRDVVAHAASLQHAFDALRQYVEDVGQRLDGRLTELEETLRSAIAHRALVRYDAYNELSGRQSVSIALLDEERSGIVLSCIHHREQARVYAKQVHRGQGELQLSPEESEAVRLALSGGGGVEDVVEQSA